MQEVINLVPILPEIVLAILVCVVLLAGVFTQKAKVVFWLAEAALVVTFVAVIYVCYVNDNLLQSILIFNNSFVLDRMAIILKLFILLCVMVTFIYAQIYNRDRQVARTEFYALALLATVGMLLLVSAHNLLTIFLGVELISLPSYAMVAMWRTQQNCIEAAMKYFITGALATGMLLYGFSMLFGATQSLDIQQIADKLSLMPFGENYIAIFGLVFSVAGLAFKIGAAPFHMWVPDVYDGAPTSVTLFISTAPKIAGFGMAIRLLTEALPGLHIQWQEMLIVLAILSMGIGNFAAIVQTNIKRLLAYSSVAHAGYGLLGLICATPRGYAASMFYVITYSIMTLAAFGVVLLLNRAGFEMEDIKDLRQLNHTNPWLAFLMLIVMFSLAGVPPLVGFIAKVGLFEALISVHMVWLTVVAILFSIVGAYYYLNVVKVMYFEREENLPKKPVEVTTGSLITISLNGVAVLVLGVFPGALFSICHWAFFL